MHPFVTSCHALCGRSPSLSSHSSIGILEPNGGFSILLSFCKLSALINSLGSSCQGLYTDHTRIIEWSITCIPSIFHAGFLVDIELPTSISSIGDYIQEPSTTM